MSDQPLPVGDSPNASTQKSDDARENISVPEPSSVTEYLLYGLSLPERTLRSTSAVVGGALRESTGLLVPQAFRSSLATCLTTVSLDI